jgi:hypothetical protein
MYEISSIFDAANVLIENENSDIHRFQTKNERASE